MKSMLLLLFCLQSTIIGEAIPGDIKKAEDIDLRESIKSGDFVVKSIYPHALSLTSSPSKKPRVTPSVGFVVKSIRPGAGENGILRVGLEHIKQQLGVGLNFEKESEDLLDKVENIKEMTLETLNPLEENEKMVEGVEEIAKGDSLISTR